MKILFKLAISFVVFFLINTSFASTHATDPSACISSWFEGEASTVVLVLANDCDEPVNFQNALVTFKSRTALNIPFWGDFGPLPQPDSPMNIKASPQDGVFLETISLHFPGSNTSLPGGKLILLKYKTPDHQHIEGSIRVTLNGGNPPPPPPPPGSGTPVERNGQLKVCGNYLCNQSGTPIQLKGMSTHGLQWYGWNNCVTPQSLDVLTGRFKADVMRISLYVQDGGYEDDPVGFTKQVNTIINEATKRGIYAIVDWHQLEPGDPNVNLDLAKKFFTDIATANKGKNNLLYEIANEPSGVSWAQIKNYANKLIPIIRAIDPKTVIIVGTRGWSTLGMSDGSNSKEIINDPINFPNIMYTFHFYASSHTTKDEYWDELNRASNTLPIFVTEWGTQTYTGDGENDFETAQRYVTLMANKKISWTNWNYSDDFRSGAIWKTGTCKRGDWVDSNLKEAGVWVTDRIKG